MWSAESNLNGQGTAALSGRGYVRVRKQKKSKRKLSGIMAMIVGAIATVEIMTAGAMILKLDFHSADIVALLFTFVVLYAGVVAVLTDN